MSSESAEMQPAVPRSRKKSREREFLVDLRGSFEDCGAFWHKIGDAPIFSGMKTRFTDAKPFDAIAIHKGVPIAIEAKYIPDYKSFGIKTLRPSQVDGLSRWRDSGGRSFVFLNVRRIADRERDVKRMNRLIIFEYWSLELLGKNIRKAELEKLPYIDGFKKRYDISEWLGAVCGPAD